MGVTNCREHGRSGTSLVCAHVRTAVVERSVWPRPARVCADIDGYAVEMSYCAACVTEGSLPVSPAFMSAEDFEQLSNTKLGPVPVCAKCLNATPFDL